MDINVEPLGNLNNKAWVRVLGGILGLESRHYLCYGQLVFRGRGAILMDDRFVVNRLRPDATIQRDSVQGMMESAIAYEISGCMGGCSNWYLGAGVE